MQPQESPIVPAASRPMTPGKEYGVSKSKKALLPWEHVVERMTTAKYYWVSTVSPNGRPHATPVDGLWLDNQLFFGGSPNTRRNRNLAGNPAVCVHLESGMDVVILHGDAEEVRQVAREVAVKLSEMSAQKYGYHQPPEAYESSSGGLFIFRPRLVFAWKDMLNDVTRWRFP